MKLRAGTAVTRHREITLIVEPARIGDVERGQVKIYATTQAVFINYAKFVLR